MKVLIHPPPPPPLNVDPNSETIQITMSANVSCNKPLAFRGWHARSCEVMSEPPSFSKVISCKCEWVLAIHRYRTSMHCNHIHELPRHMIYISYNTTVLYYFKCHETFWYSWRLSDRSNPLRREKTLIDVEKHSTDANSRKDWTFLQSGCSKHVTVWLQKLMQNQNVKLTWLTTRSIKARQIQKSKYVE